MIEPDGLTPRRIEAGSHTTEGADPKMVEALYRRIIRPLRKRAYDCGYALAVHGSLARDIDLIAVPWTDRAFSADKFATAFRQKLASLYDIELEVPADQGHPKPHGRLCWSFWIRPWTYVDLSVYPPLSPSNDQ